VARETLAKLRSRLRRLVADPAGSNQVWADEELDDALDHNRREARYAHLKEIETIQPSGSVLYLIYEAGVGDWEDGAALTDSSFNPLTTGITEDLLTGRWTFTTMPNRPVHVTGFYYDLYGAAVEILENWQAREKLSFDAQADQQSFKRSQKFEMLAQMADRYRGQMWAGSACLIQSDFIANAYEYRA
jgi:hypothetical protein